ncbi:MAG TPA: chorismate synthase [Candidatus Methanomethylophilaceae archaeon]|nr:chorismate synthase [Candidatus Methanomethylophilaceae archaeon]
MNTIGMIVRTTLWGASHGPYVGCILEGIRGGLSLDYDSILEDMRLRAPQNDLGTSRRETDQPNFVSGVDEGVCNGDPISILIENKNVRSDDYIQFKTQPRPGHADFTALTRNPYHDIRGGGMFSGRMTAPLVAAGSICRAALKKENVTVAGFTRSIGQIHDHSDRDLEEALSSRDNPTRACSVEIDKRMAAEIRECKSKGDSTGGVVECRIYGMPVGVGEPWFDTFDGEMAKAMFSIPAMRAFEIGDGVSAASSKGSINNDPFRIADGSVVTDGNKHGGVLGGRTSGMPVVMRCYFKPTPSIAIQQRTVDIKSRKEVEMSVGGRHDPCIVPRAVAVVEAMACITALDMMERGGFIGH